MQRGFLTLEILLAMTLMTLTFAGVLFASSGTNNFLIGAQSNREALSNAQALLAQEESLAQVDFNLVNSVATTTSDIYQQWVDVEPVGNFAKDVTSYVQWSNPSPHQVSLTTRITDYQDAVGGNTCSSVLVGNWHNPTVTSFSLSSLIGDTSTTTYPITSLDAYNGRLYVTVSNTSVNTKTFFIFDVSNPAHPALLGSLDNDTTNKTGLAAVAVATSSAGSYAYLASASSFAKGQLQILEVSDPANIQILKTYKIATTTAPAAGSGNTIFYKDGYVYLGLTKSTGGKEFVIVDVHNPANPQMLGSYAIGHDVNSILVKNNYAYIAHPTDTTQKQQLTVLDVSDKTNPTLVDSFYTGDINAHGKSVAVVGSTTYVGMTVSSTTPELYIRGANSLEVSSSVIGFLVRDWLSFFLTTKQATTSGALQIVSTKGILPLITVALPGTSPSGVALDCEGNYLYAASNDTSNNGFISIVTGS